ncbi:PAP_fibrillin domain-containing protein [Haematococcus lacustris]|uniref:PAP_fibrillin domain-containing protein n=1 Tax=Haematococcus lacustris TaxID=44745 RepID=A0A699ZNT3_HAELA|nr:PAP_fibrillin domain-containing protein [Haematococcus lacustris]
MDGGMAMPEALKAEVDSLLDELEAVGRQQEPRPLASPLIWGNYW